MKTFSLFIFSAILSCYLSAQSSISGIVSDKATGKPIGSVNIIITELNTGTVTDSMGNYHFNYVPTGKFHIQFTHIGYSSFVTLVDPASLAKVDVQLEMTSIETDEVVITSPYNSAGDNTAYTIDVLSKEDMRASGKLSLSGALEAIPGVHMLGLGLGNTKPVIRGLRGNRILTLINGFRFDNQQWQDEHGLGLSDMGIDRVEVIKGPASVIFGSDAMGGVINLIEESPAPIGKTIGYLNTKFNTNTLQAGGEVVVKGSKERMNWKLNLGGESNTNYVDAHNDLAFNTRFNGDVIKFGMGFNRNKFVTNFNYNFSDYKFGFVDAGEFFKTSINYDEERFSRNMEEAFHIVQYHLLYSKTTFFLKRSRMTVDAGAHLNHRKEHEDANNASAGEMDMHLYNYSINLRWIKALGEKTELIAGTQDMYQTNKNIGTRMIIPDAVTSSVSAYTFMKHTLNKIIIEEGARFNLYSIDSKEHGDVDSLMARSDAWMPAFNRSFSSFNAALGCTWSPVKKLLIKMNLATGFRAPNQAELSANGFHEGFTFYEMGDNNLKEEQNAEGDLSVRFGEHDLKIEASGFYNTIKNYIYLAIADTFFENRFIYNYKQTDAILEGGEAGLDWEPSFAKWLDLKANFCTVIAMDRDSNYLPFMPSDRIMSELKIRFKDMKKLTNSFMKVSVTNSLEQWRIASQEAITPGYTVVDFSVGGLITGKKIKLDLSLFCTNLLNEYYYDHLSLVKPGTMPGGRGFYSMGRNIGLVAKFIFGK